MEVAAAVAATKDEEHAAEEVAQDEAAVVEEAEEAVVVLMAKIRHLRSSSLGKLECKKQMLQPTPRNTAVDRTTHRLTNARRRAATYASNSPRLVPVSEEIIVDSRTRLKLRSHSPTEPR
jgi:hypothetical protein